MKTYISGAITGIPNAEQLFEQAEKKIEGEFVNPMKLPHLHDKTWHSYMREDLKALLDCNQIAMMPNWEISRGAKIERDLAFELGIHVIYLK